jgi:hypothetical protein
MSAAENTEIPGMDKKKLTAVSETFSPCLCDSVVIRV